MKRQDKVGDKVPEVSFKIRENSQWVTRTTKDFFQGKRVVFFALPGAFTPTCSSVHLPRYNELYDAIRSNGIDDVICLAVNDSFVLNEWKKVEKADNITMLPDGNGEFTRQLGLLVNKQDLCFGERSWRYSMVVNDGIIEKMFIEPDDEEDPFGVSSAENMLKYLNPNAPIPESITIFTKKDCSYSARAKELLESCHLPFEEHVLLQDFTIKTVKALSNSTKLPQVFINGRRIGGAEELEKHIGQKEN
jgi:peroxiredoxin/glutaredoxin